MLESNTCAYASHGSSGTGGSGARSPAVPEPVASTGDGRGAVTGTARGEPLARLLSSAYCDLVSMAFVIRIRRF